MGRFSVEQEREQEAQKKADEANLTTSLTLKIKENFANALVFNTNMFETTLNALYDKVSSFTGMYASQTWCWEIIFALNDCYFPCLRTITIARVSSQPVLYLFYFGENRDNRTKE